MVVITYLMAPAYGRCCMPPMTVYNVGVVVGHIYHLSLAGLDINDFTGVPALGFNFNIVVSHQVACIMGVLAKHLHTVKDPALVN